MKKIRSSKKYLAVTLIVVLLVGMMTGCMGERAAISFREDGTCGYSMKYLFEKTVYDYMQLSDPDSSSLELSILQSGDFQTGTEHINGKDYYIFSRDFSFANYNEMIDFLTKRASYIAGLRRNSLNPKCYDSDFDAPFSAITMDASGFMGTINPDGEFFILTDSDMGSVEPSSMLAMGYDSVAAYYKSLGVLFDITVTLPMAVTESNGAIADKTVSWTLESIPADGKLIAAVSGNPISTDVTPPTIDGVRENGMYGAVEVTGKDDVSLKSLVLDGVSRNTDTLLVTTPGKHTVTATDFNNNSVTVNFSVDRKKPKIKGVKNGKTYKRPVTLRFSDNVGVRYVVVNDKKIKSKKKVTLKKPGTYTVIVVDKCNNYKGVYFRIKKK